MNEKAQDFQDDLDYWGDCSAEVILRDENGNAATDLVLLPSEVRIMFAALRDHYKSLNI